jgi:hypothetical protein
MANHNTNKSSDIQTAERSRYWLTEPLRLPPDEFRIDQLCTEFETPKQAHAEDKMKADLLQREGEQPSKLENHLRAPFKGRELKSMASSQDMYHLRINILGNMWRMMSETSHFQPHSFSLSSRWWESDEVGLEYVEADEFMGWVHQQIDEAGGEDADGYLIAYLRGRHDETRERWKYYVDGFVCGELIDVIDRLRDDEFFSSTIEEGATVHIAPQPIHDIPAALCEFLKPNWTCKHRTIIGNDGQQLSTDIGLDEVATFDPDPVGWLDTAYPKDIILLKNLRVSPKTGRLKLTL